MVPLLAVPLYVVPTERTENTEAYGLKLLQVTARLQPIYWERGRLVPKIVFSNPQNGLRFARQETTEMIAWGRRRPRRRVIVMYI